MPDQRQRAAAHGLSRSTRRLAKRRLSFPVFALHISLGANLSERSIEDRLLDRAVMVIGLNRPSFRRIVALAKIDMLITLSMNALGRRRPHGWFRLAAHGSRQSPFAPASICAFHSVRRFPVA